MADGGGESHRAGDADLSMQAFRASVTALEQKFDALSLDVQGILAAVGGGVNVHRRPHKE